MNNENMELWDSVCKTDPSHTKKAKIGQMNITAICPQYQRKAATAMFGPYGSGWGVIDDKYEFLDFTDGTKLCTYTATLWYNLDGSKNEFPIQSNIKVAFVTQAGEGYLKIDDEYAKKAATDALTKGLSMLGFNSDVFEGRYDDNKYVNKMREEFAPEPSVVNIKPVLKSFVDAPDQETLKAKLDKAESMTQYKGNKEIKAAFDARVKELLNG
jgi:hypothetical protein